MDEFVKGFFKRQEFLRILDALILPCLFVAWYRGNTGGFAATAHGGAPARPGLVLFTLFMILVIRAAVKVEQAVRAPETYRWDIERAARWLVLLIILALAIRLLA